MRACLRDFLILFSVFARKKVIVNGNVSFVGHALEYRFQMAENWP